MDTAATWVPGADSPTIPASESRHLELLLDALKTAIIAPGEHRLFRAAKLPGLFHSRVGAGAEAALLALREGLLETVRTETRGRVITEWVRATPRAVAFVNEHDSPKSVLKELKELLDTTRAGVPSWMADAQSELQLLSSRFQERATAVLKHLNELAVRVDAALRRAEAKLPTVAEPMTRVVPWAVEVLEYLDQRAVSGASADCSLPELFHAMRVRYPDLPLAEFQDGLRRLHDVRALRCVPMPESNQPEFAVVVDGQVAGAVRR